MIVALALMLMIDRAGRTRSAIAHRTRTRTAITATPGRPNGATARPAHSLAAVCNLADAQLLRLAAELDRARPRSSRPAGKLISGGPWPGLRR
jgi:hypothetical protein